MPLMTAINNSMAFDPVLALVANNFFQQDLDFFTALREAGIAEEDFDDYVVNDQGEIVSRAAARPSATAQDTQDSFAGDGYGFAYDENGELLPADSVAGQEALTRQADPPLDLSYQYNDVDGYDIFDENGTYITTVGTEQEAIVYIQNAGAAGLGVADQEAARINTEAAEAQLAGAAGADTKAKLAQAKQQFQLQQRYNQTTQGDWRVTLRLAPDASYLYKAPGIAAGDILSPLAASDGVIFPYTPTITTNYVARYEPYELVHSNYRGFFYKNSHVGEIQINGIFTAQDTAEAQYLLAVIHFFRSCTKMFYGQDPQFRGSPPPLVELSGYGQYQFNNHPCLVSNFNYTLPNGVDYIRVSPNNLSQGLSLANRRQPVSANTVSIDSVVNRLKNSGLLPGAQPQAARSDLGYVSGTTSGTVQTTYVPTKMEIQLTLLPTQTRQQVSQGFSLEEFARGRLLTGGFW